MKKLSRSKDDRIVAGVCGGFAEYFKIDSTIIRLIWIFITVFGGIGILAYIFSLILIPEGEKKEIKQKSEDDDQDEKLVVWGVIIIIVGVLLFFIHRPIVGIFWHTFTANWLNIVIAVVLIGLGIYLIINRNKEDDELTNTIKTTRFHLSETDKKVAGVCGGLAESFMVDSTLIRLLWILGTLVSGGIGIILYIFCMFIFQKD